MKRTLRVALFPCLFAFALAGSSLSLTSGKAAPGVKSAARTQTTKPASSPTPRVSATPQASASPQRDERLWQRAMAIHRRAIIVDWHNDIPTIMVDENYDLGTPSAGKYHTDLQRLKQSGMTGEFFSIYVDRQYATPEWIAKNYVTEGGSARRALDLIDMTYRMVEKYPKDLMLATSTADIRRAKREGKGGVLMGIEGGHAIESSLSALREFYRLGVRYMTLTHNNTNEWADACCDEAKHNGLTDFGKEGGCEMNRLRMIADSSPGSDKTMWDVLDVSKPPVMASPSSARVFSNHKRNIPEELLKRIGQNGGVVMVNFYTVFLDERVRQASLARDATLKAQRDALSAQFQDDPRRLRAELQKLDDANPLPTLGVGVLADRSEERRVGEEGR